MGAIQNSLNQALGSVAVAGRMIGAEKDSQIAAGKTALENKDEIEKADKEATIEEMDFNPLVEAEHKEMKEKESSLLAQKTPMANIQGAIIHNDLEASEKAFAELKIQQEAAHKRKDNAEKALARARSWGGAL